MANTTADKLQSVLDTKEAIRLALNTKGREVTASTPFREYANEVLAIETGGGELDPTLATATSEDVFAPATFYAGNTTIKTGALDPYIEYMKFDKTLNQLESCSVYGTATESDYAMWKSRVEMYDNRIFKGEELKRWLL